MQKTPKTPSKKYKKQKKLKDTKSMYKNTLHSEEEMRKILFAITTTRNAQE